MVMYFGQRGEREYHSPDEIGQDDGQSEVTISKMEKCPYTDRCPGFEDIKGCLGAEGLMPKAGFTEVADGTLCLEWDVVVPKE